MISTGSRWNRCRCRGDSSWNSPSSRFSCWSWCCCLLEYLDRFHDDSHEEYEEHEEHEDPRRSTKVREGPRRSRNLEFLRGSSCSSWIFVDFRGSSCYPIFRRIRGVRNHFNWPLPVGGKAVTSMRQIAPFLNSIAFLRPSSRAASSPIPGS